MTYNSHLNFPSWGRCVVSVLWQDKLWSLTSSLELDTNYRGGGGFKAGIQGIPKIQMIKRKVFLDHFKFWHQLKGKTPVAYITCLYHCFSPLHSLIIEKTSIMCDSKHDKWKLSGSAIASKKIQTFNLQWQQKICIELLKDCCENCEFQLHCHLTRLCIKVVHSQLCFAVT